MYFQKRAFTERKKKRVEYGRSSVAAKDGRR